MSVAKKPKEDARHTSVLFTGTVKLANSAICIFKTTLPISNLHIFCLTYTQLHISKLKEIASVVLKIFVPENCPIFFTFFFFAHNPSNTLTSLQLFHDSVEGHIRSLASFGKSTDSYYDFLVSVILEKLPNKTRNHLAREHVDKEWIF